MGIGEPRGRAAVDRGGEERPLAGEQLHQHPGVRATSLLHQRCIHAQRNEASLAGNFRELRYGEVLRILLPRTSVNSARTCSVHRRDVFHDIEEEANYRGPKRRRRYNAFPDPPTERGGWVLGENQITNANTNGPIRVLLADDHTMFRQGLASILASYGGMEVIAEVPND